MATTMQKSETSMTFGDSLEIDALAKRIKVMVPGGGSLKDNEALALAQISQACGLNPFIGEVWYIPGKGGMVGIRGARRYANQQVKEEGGKDAFWFPDIQVCAPDVAGAMSNEKVVASFKCVIHDSSSTFQYQRALSSLIETLRVGGAPDPFGDAVKIVGPKPQWIGYGYTTEAETSRMNKMQLARKRAEADAIKRRFYIPFGAGVSEFEERAEAGTTYTDADPLDDVTEILVEPKSAEPKRSTEQNLVVDSNPDPIDDKTWDSWLALCHRAEKFNVPYANVDREKTTKTDLRAGYEELAGYVREAKAQAQAA